MTSAALVTPILSERERQLLLELKRRGLTAPQLDFETPPPWMLRHPGQMEAWNARVRFLRVMAGWQAGKTDFLVWYCLRQIGRRGPGDAIVAAATFPLLVVALQPRLVREIESRGLGEKRGDGQIVVPYDSLRRCGYEGDEKGGLSIWLRHASDAKAVEAATAKWFALDECGQTSDEIGEAVQGRVSATGGEACLISRHYYDNWFSRACKEPDVPGFSKTVNFASWDNPGWRPDLTGPARDAEVQRLRRSMPEWRFDMKYGGRSSRPAGSIIDNWRDEYEVAPFLVPGDWRRFTFHDFGPVHAFVLSVAEHPTEKDAEGYPVLYVYRETYPNRSASTKEIVSDLRRTEDADLEAWASAVGVRPAPKWHPRGIGGANTEEGWRESYTAAGLNVEKPRVPGIDPQIDRLYACVGRGGLRIVKRSCPTLLSMLKAWSWEVDDAGEPIPGKIKDDQKFHGPAALRYGVSQLRPNRKDKEPEPQEPPMGTLESYGRGNQPKAKSLW